MVSGGGPYYAPLAEMDFAEVRADVERHLVVPMRVARLATGKVRPGGSLVFISGTGGRRRGMGLTLIGALTAATPALTENLAVEIAPIRVNLVAPGFVDTGRAGVGRRRAGALPARRGARGGPRGAARAAADPARGRAGGRGCALRAPD